MEPFSTKDKNTYSYVCIGIIKEQSLETTSFSQHLIILSLYFNINTHPLAVITKFNICERLLSQRLPLILSLLSKGNKGYNIPAYLFVVGPSRQRSVLVLYQNNIPTQFYCSKWHNKTLLPQWEYEKHYVYWYKSDMKLNNNVVNMLLKWHYHLHAAGCSLPSVSSPNVLCSCSAVPRGPPPRRPERVAELSMSQS